MAATNDAHAYQECGRERPVTQTDLANLKTEFADSKTEIARSENRQSTVCPTRLDSGFRPNDVVLQEPSFG